MRVLGESLARELLLIGKSINFVRSCCGDTEWVMDAATTATFESAGTYAVPVGIGFAGVDRYVLLSTALPNVSALTAMSKAASAAVNKHLITLLFDKFMILEHLRALKQFLLLGQVRRYDRVGAQQCMFPWFLATCRNTFHYVRCAHAFVCSSFGLCVSPG